MATRGVLTLLFLLILLPEAWAQPIVRTAAREGFTGRLSGSCSLETRGGGRLAYSSVKIRVGRNGRVKGSTFREGEDGSSLLLSLRGRVKEGLFGSNSLSVRVEDGMKINGAVRSWRASNRSFAAIPVAKAKWRTLRGYCGLMKG